MRSTGSRKRYTLPEKLAAVDTYKKAREAGKNTQDAAKETGVSYAAVLAWSKQLDDSGTITVRTPEGFTISGITLEDLHDVASKIGLSPTDFTQA